MRVIAGKARRIPLVSPEGRETRPTTDRVKETLFNIIQDDIPGSQFLDLFSGSGGIGIEALSRGAKEAVFVEYAKKALDCIHANLDKTKLKEQAVILPTEVSHGLSRLGKMGKKFDIVYADPPYQKGYEAQILNWLLESEVVKSGTLVILESSRETLPDFVSENDYEVIRIKEYKNNQHVFLRVR